MQSLLLGVAVLACPVGMGLMMWMMMRGQGKDTAASEDHSWQQEVQMLRAEIEHLKAQRANDRTTGGR
ncbi:MAG: hypothetical protein QOE94_2936 [Mycobacterium sp.]|jgi:hypothetical protein|nr:hypothetical protein [Mycobacterium sp.]MDT7721925.1 hypothetical protein [Mycobacterium sp.]MDT7763781.1 hypothetical protein [Mycobacterium sp.]